MCNNLRFFEITRTSNAEAATLITPRRDPMGCQICKGPVRIADHATIGCGSSEILIQGTDCRLASAGRADRAIPHCGGERLWL
jgi:hypothetical protein